MSYKPEFARLIEEALLRLDRPPAWLAQRLGVSQSTVSRWLNQGARPRDPETVVRVADVLDIRRQQLLRAAGFGYEPEPLKAQYTHRPAPDTAILPLEQTPFIGREAQLARIAERLADPNCRLLTILGTGGIGKTRLAIHVAHDQAVRFADGVGFVDLTQVGDPSTLASAVLRILDAPESGEVDAVQRLCDFVRERELLLVLDNFEHLLEGAELLQVLLRAAPGLKLVVTSRERLNLVEEWLEPVEGLELPPDQEMGADNSLPKPRLDLLSYEATRLFLTSARRLRPEYAPSHQEALAIVSICRTLEGMPLAIELAASWIRTLGAEEIAVETASGLDILSTGMRNVPERHSSIRATLEQSWQHLGERERQAFAQLSVFQGGFRRRAAQLVTEAPLSILANLVDRSLLRYGPDGRYAMHELIRQYAAERLSETPILESQARRRHAEAYATFLHERAETLFGTRQNEVLEEIRPELANVRAAQQWALAHADAETLDRLVYVHYLYCDWRGHYNENTEVLEHMVERLAAMDQTAQVLRSTATCYAFLGWCNIRLGRLNESVAWAERSESILAEHDIEPGPGFGAEPLAALALARHVLGDYEKALSSAHSARWRDVDRGDDLNLMIADYVLCGIYLALNDLERAQAYGTDAATLAERHGNRWFQAYVIMKLGNIAMAQGDTTAARRYYQESYALKEACDDPEGMAAALNKLGRIAFGAGSYREAERLHARSLALYEEISDPGGRAVTLQGLANSAAALGDAAQAVQAYTQALELLQSIRFWPRISLVLVDIARLLGEQGNLLDAMRLLQAIETQPSADAATRRMAHEARVKLSPGAQADEMLESSVGMDADPTILVAEARQALDELREALRVSALPADPIMAANQQLVAPLTSRELEVLQLISYGSTNAQIAEELTITLGTVKSHTAQIYGKLAVRNRTQATNRARELGLLR